MVMKMIAPLVTSLILALPATAQSSPRIAELLDTANDFVTVGNYRQAQEYFKKARRETQDACEAMHIAASELAAQELERLIRAQEFGARRDELSGGILCYRKWDEG
jgi:hypothetical protein